MIELSKTNAQIDRQFIWRDKDGFGHLISNMETRHLFYVLRMVWNHSAPENLKIEPYQRYNFGSHYTASYMKDAVLNISNELQTRKDLTPYFGDCLTFMARNYQVFEARSLN